MISYARAPGELKEQIKQLAPQILGALNDKEPAAHASMWDMVLSFLKAYPTAWRYVDVQKAIVPRLAALLRCAVTITLWHMELTGRRFILACSAERAEACML